jgi:DnaK suppressor protein
MGGAQTPKARAARRPEPPYALARSLHPPRIMRQQFHRCRSLRVVEVDASELPHGRGAGRMVLDELCEARQLAPCVGLEACDVLTPGQKRDLLVTRATRIRDEAGPAELAGEPNARAVELEGLKRDLLRDRDAIVAANNELEDEIRQLLSSAGDPERPGFEAQLRFREALDRLMVGRLDAIDAALDALRAGAYGRCEACGSDIDVERLRVALGTRVCSRCAQGAGAPDGA